MMQTFARLLQRSLIILGLVIGVQTLSAQAASDPYSGIGTISYVNLTEQVIVIDDGEYKLPVSTSGSSQTLLKKGMRVNFDFIEGKSGRTLTGISISPVK